MQEIFKDIPGQIHRLKCAMYTFDPINNVFPFFTCKSPGHPGKLQSITSHNHAVPELLYVKTGHLYISVGGGDFDELGPGEVFCLNPYETHTGFIRDDEKTEYYYLHFSLALISCNTGELSQTVGKIASSRLCFAHSVGPEDTQRLADSITAIHDHLTAPKWNEPLLEVAELHRIMAVLTSNLIESDRSGSPDPGFITQANIYLGEHYKQQVSTKDAAAALGFEESYFCSLFKKNFGKSFLNYLTEYRINKAVLLLQFGDDPLVKVAELAGFNNYNYFSRCFKKQTGFTPRDVRNINQPK